MNTPWTDGQAYTLLCVPYVSDAYRRTGDIEGNMNFQSVPMAKNTTVEWDEWMIQ